MPRDTALFNRVDWFSVVQNQQTAMQKEIAQYDGNRLLNTSVDELCRYFVEKYDIDIPELQRDSIVVDQREDQVDVSHRFDYLHRDGGTHFVPGTTVELTIPFSGEANAFGIQPTTYDFNPPEGIVNARNNTIVLEFTSIQPNPEDTKRQIDEALAKIETYLGYLRTNAASLKSTLPELARREIEARRTKLLANQNLVSSLGFPLKRNPNSSQTFAAPSVRRKLPPTPPPASSAPYRPEPTLPTEEYEHILDVLQNMAHVMERSPSAFAKIDEEALRMHFLLQLNGHYEGNATGETFNCVGKTDILIRVDGKNIFIGECKFWGGPKMLIETIDQLLGYSSWRDTKVAVLVFNRNKDLSKVIEAIKATVPTHPNHKRLVSQVSETSIRYIFSHINDANREMLLTIMVFDVPT